MLSQRLVLVLLCLFPLFPHAAEPDLLEPDRAFRFSARIVDPGAIELNYRIAPGYYLYRDKFRFSAEPAVALGKAQFPAGEIKDDEFFGRVETFRDELKIRLPFDAASAPPQFTLKSFSQGCADVGVCYIPHEQKAELKLAAASTSASDARNSGIGAGNIVAALRNASPPASTSNVGEDEFLPPDQAFRLDIEVRDANTLIANFKPADTYYLYRDKIGFSLPESAGVQIAKIALPAGEMKADPNFGDTEVYHRPFQAVISLQRGATASGPLQLEATYQGCSDKGLCYPPEIKNFTLAMAVAAGAGVGGDAGAVSGPSSPQTSPVTAPESEDARIAALLEGGSLWVILASFFGFGLLLALTPCVFPMIPILSGIIVGQGQTLTRTRAFGLSLAYVLGMAITYALAGVAAGLSGALLSAALQNPWVLGTFAAVFVLLAFSMFGFYELQLPASLQSRLSERANRMQGGHLAGVFAMGVLSAIIVGPCVAAPLAGALLYISQTRDVVFGGTALFAMALGMGLPLLVIGTSAGALLPKAGAWMEAVKRFFGVLLLGVAIWLISPVISPLVHMLLWAALLIISAIYLHAIDPLPPGVSDFRKLWKGVGVIALLVGVAILVGAMSGGRDVLQPLAGLRAGGGANATPASHLAFDRIKTVAELDQRIVAAGGKPVMLDFYADWCVSCKEMERFTFSNERVQARLKDVILLQADVTANNADDKALLKRFGLFGPPGIIFFDTQGAEVGHGRVIGYQPADKFLASVNTALQAQSVSTRQ
ncbi:MAG: protein-disulfide reductase DsbD [Burkholderiales bacterium]|nr:protein-disulfide reductase DsbD [Burkholderiales bacterium]